MYWNVRSNLLYFKYHFDNPCVIFFSSRRTSSLQCSSLIDPILQYHATICFLNYLNSRNDFYPNFNWNEIIVQSQSKLSANWTIKQKFYFVPNTGGELDSLNRTVVSNADVSRTSCVHILRTNVITYIQDVTRIKRR